MTTYNPDTKTYINDNGEVYVNKKGRKPAWVNDYINNQNGTDQISIVTVVESIQAPIDQSPIVKKESSMTTVFKNPIYKEFIESISQNQIIFNKEIKTVASIKDVMIRIKFNMTQHGIQEMSFNNDFHNIQKADDGTLVMSAECFNRHAFEQNDLQDNFTITGLIDKMFLLRGGIRTDKDKKENNVSLIKAINTSVRSNSYKTVKNDRLGFKADDNGENYLCEDQLYLNTVFDVKVHVPINQFLKNIMGTDFAQKNALKVIIASDTECQKLIDSCIPTQNHILDIDAIASIILEKIKSNIKHFSHRGICAEFAISNLSITADII